MVVSKAVMKWMGSCSPSFDLPSSLDAFYMCSEPSLNAIQKIMMRNSIDSIDLEELVSLALRSKLFFFRR